MTAKKALLKLFDVIHNAGLRKAIDFKSSPINSILNITG